MSLEHIQAEQRKTQHSMDQDLITGDQFRPEEGLKALISFANLTNHILGPEASLPQEGKLSHCTVRGVVGGAFFSEHCQLYPAI